MKTFLQKILEILRINEKIVNFFNDNEKNIKEISQNIIKTKVIQKILRKI